MNLKPLSVLMFPATSTHKTACPITLELRTIHLKPYILSNANAFTGAKRKPWKSTSFLIHTTTATHAAGLDFFNSLCPQPWRCQLRAPIQCSNGWSRTPVATAEDNTSSNHHQRGKPKDDASSMPAVDPHSTENCTPFYSPQMSAYKAFQPILGVHILWFVAILGTANTCIQAFPHHLWGRSPVTPLLRPFFWGWFYSIEN